MPLFEMDMLQDFETYISKGRMWLTIQYLLIYMWFKNMYICTGIDVDLRVGQKSLS